jgi:hypothetical protein
MDINRRRARACGDPSREEHSRLSPPDPRELATLTKWLANFEGHEAILVDPPAVHRVILDTIRVDDAGLTVTYTASPPSSISSPFESSGTLYAAWDVLDIAPGIWTTRYVGWTLCLDPSALGGGYRRHRE